MPPENYRGTTSKPALLQQVAGQTGFARMAMVRCRKRPHIPVAGRTAKSPLAGQGGRLSNERRSSMMHFEQTRLSGTGARVTPELVEYYVRRGRKMRAELLRRGGRRIWSAMKRMTGLGGHARTPRLTARPAR